jgi:hypothetical protein
MHGVVGAVVAGAGIIAEELDPTVQPVRQSFYVFVFLAVCTILLILSLLRHLRRAQGNLGSARAAGEPPTIPQAAIPQTPQATTPQATTPQATTPQQGEAPSPVDGDPR